MFEAKSEIACLKQENQALQRRIAALEEENARYQRSAREYRAILENSGTAIVVVDANHIIVRANPEFTKLTGYSRQETEGRMPWTKFVVPRDLARMTEYARRRRQAGGEAPRNYEFDIVDRFGRLHNIFMTTAMIDGTDLNIASLMDITDLKQAEAARRESEQGFATAFHHLPHPAAITEVDTGRLLEVNRAMEDLCEYRAEELIGKTTVEIGLWSDPAQRDHAIRKLRQDGRLDGYQQSIQTRRGKTKLVRIWLVTLPTRGRQRMLSIYVDITGELAREKFQAAVLETATSMGLGICVESRSFTPQSRLDYVNQAMAEMVGLNPAEMVGRMRMMDLVHQDSMELVHQYVESARQRRVNNDRFDISLKAPHGGKIIAEVALSQTEVDGQPALVAFCRDVTLARKMEQQMQSTQRMEALGSLAGGIAHDFNNLLMAVVGYSELALMAAKGQERLEEYLGQVIKACGRGRELVRQIITFSRGDQTPLRAVAVGRLVQDTLKLVTASLPPHIRLIADIEVENDAVMANPSYINQVLMNLCTNAAQAIGEASGEIRVSLRESRVPDGPGGRPDLRAESYLKLTVADNGPGIESEVLDLIFDPFFTTKRSGGGTGMGLAVVHGIVQSLDGFIEVRSTPGQGTAFDIWLPLVDSDPEAPPPQPPPSQEMPTGSERILLVEDEAALATAMAGVLEELGYQVDLASDGRVGLAKFRAAPQDYDLVISDQSMPNMVGTEMAQLMLDLRPDLPVIIATGYGGGLTPEEVSDMGLAAFLPKPYRIRQLARLIRQVLDGDAPS